MESQDVQARFKQYRNQLMPYAYNILGDSMAAEDVVQDVLNQFLLNPHQDVQSPTNYLIRSVINRSINEKKRMQRSRDEKYNGQWLPTPIYSEDSIYRGVDKMQQLNYALLVLLERLNPKERAVIILRDSFDFAHNEVAELLGETTENSRQLYRRARKKLEPEIGRIKVNEHNSGKVLHDLSDAILHADLRKVKELLSDEVKSYSDGGTKLRAARNVIEGKHNVGKFLQAMYGKYFLDGTTVVTAEMNQMPALLFKTKEGIYRCMIFEMVDGRIQNVFIIIDPDKLKAMGVSHRA